VLINPYTDPWPFNRHLDELERYAADNHIDDFAWQASWDGKFSGMWGRSLVT
jgi:hypothetical protein